jgi:hypothetical protein
MKIPWYRWDVDLPGLLADRGRSGHPLEVDISQISVGSLDRDGSLPVEVGGRVIVNPQGRAEERRFAFRYLIRPGKAPDVGPVFDGVWELASERPVFDDRP